MAPDKQKRTRQLREHRFDDFAEAECATLSVVTIGRLG
jgi:hypothetical protein